MEDSISRDNVEVTIIRSDSRKQEKRTPEQLDAIIKNLS